MVCRAHVKLAREPGSCSEGESDCLLVFTGCLITKFDSPDNSRRGPTGV